jgi:hypothetical protein
MSSEDEDEDDEDEDVDDEDEVCEDDAAQRVIPYFVGNSYDYLGGL